MMHYAAWLTLCVLVGIGQDGESYISLVRKIPCRETKFKSLQRQRPYSTTDIKAIEITNTVRSPVR